MLLTIGVQATVVSDGIECLEVLSRDDFQYDIVFMDIILPRMDGYTTTSEIRRLEQERFVRAFEKSSASPDTSSRGQRLPYRPPSPPPGMDAYEGGLLAGLKRMKIVGLSSNARGEHIQAGLACGMDEYIVKPWKKDDILRGQPSSLLEGRKYLHDHLLRPSSRAVYLIHTELSPSSSGHFPSSHSSSLHGLNSDIIDGFKGAALETVQRSKDQTRPFTSSSSSSSPSSHPFAFRGAPSAATPSNGKSRSLLVPAWFSLLQLHIILQTAYNLPDVRQAHSFEAFWSSSADAAKSGNGGAVASSDDVPPSVHGGGHTRRGQRSSSADKYSTVSSKPDEVAGAYTRTRHGSISSRHHQTVEGFHPSYSSVNSGASSNDYLVGGGIVIDARGRHKTASKDDAAGRAASVTRFQRPSSRSTSRSREPPSMRKGVSGSVPPSLQDIEDEDEDGIPHHSHGGSLPIRMGSEPASKGRPVWVPSDAKTESGRPSKETFSVLSSDLKNQKSPERDFMKGYDHISYRIVEPQDDLVITPYAPASYIIHSHPHSKPMALAIDDEEAFRYSFFENVRDERFFKIEEVLTGLHTTLFYRYHDFSKETTFEIKIKLREILPFSEKTDPGPLLPRCTGGTDFSSGNRFQKPQNVLDSRIPIPSLSAIRSKARGSLKKPVPADSFIPILPPNNEISGLDVVNFLLWETHHASAADLSRPYHSRPLNDSGFSSPTTPSFDSALNPSVQLLSLDGSKRPKRCYLCIAFGCEKEGGCIPFNRPQVKPVEPPLSPSSAGQPPKKQAVMWSPSSTGSFFSNPDVDATSPTHVDRGPSPIPAEIKHPQDAQEFFEKPCCDVCPFAIRGGLDWTPTTMPISDGSAAVLFRSKAGELAKVRRDFLDSGGRCLGWRETDGSGCHLCPASVRTVKEVVDDDDEGFERSTVPAAPPTTIHIGREGLKVPFSRSLHFSHYDLGSDEDELSGCDGISSFRGKGESAFRPGHWNDRSESSVQYGLGSDVWD
ncbi:hypothetical protein HDU97_008740 [Phlyctochytrium planicorne]|nr:hypothetical protein HDU97_008740 [Phlyctochytrium planicorne]